eukprot:522482_1
MSESNRKKKYNSLTPEKKPTEFTQSPAHKKPKKAQKSPSLKLCNQLIDTFDHEPQEEAKSAWKKLFGKSRNNDNNSNTKSKNQNKNKKAKTDDKNKKKGKKTIDPKSKDAICNIFVKVYNKIIPILAARENDNNKYKSIVVDKPDTAQDLNSSIQDVTLDETKQILTKGMKIIRSLNSLLSSYSLEEKNKMDGDGVVSVSFVRQQLNEKYDNCVRKDDDDERYYCFDCKGYDPDWLYDMYAPKGDGYVRGGIKGDRFRAPSIWNHLIGDLHKEIKKRKEGKGTTLDQMVVKMSTSDEELVTRICIIVYIDCKRPPLCGNNYPCRRLVESLVKHATDIGVFGVWKDFEPNRDDIVHNNPTYYAEVLKFISEDVDDEFVRPILKAAIAIDHSVDGWDHKGEKYNHDANCSMPDGNTKQIYLGLECSETFGAAGEVQTILQVYENKKIDTNIKRPNSLTLDSTKMHSGCKAGALELYKQDCKDKKFKWIPHGEWCTAHDGQNFIKLVYMKENQNKTYYMAPKKTVLLFIDIKQLVTQSINKLNVSNYMDIFKKWVTGHGYGDVVHEIVSLTKTKEIRFADFILTSSKQLKRIIILLLHWSCHLILSKPKDVVLKLRKLVMWMI